jgi:uncharacterized membrane protein HdeD (DUF308 family)
MSSADRYAPPRTDVADIAAPDALLAVRPRSVVWACLLTLASMAVGFVSLLPFVDPPMSGEPAAMTAMVWGITLVVAVIELWILRSVWQRRNWARWVMVALTVFGIAFSVPTLAEDWTRAPLLAWLSIASCAIGAVAAALLLAHPAARWFKGTTALE